MDNNEEQLDNNNLASIRYTLSETGEIIIDIEIEDFDNVSLESLGTLCGQMSSEQIAYETVAHIRNLLIENNQVSLLLPIVTKLNQNSTMISKLFKSPEGQDKNKEQPCISPLDMM